MGNEIFLLNLGRLINAADFEKNDILIKEGSSTEKKSESGQNQWFYYNSQDSVEIDPDQLYQKGFRARITMADPIKNINFHIKGDYLVSVCPNAQKKTDQIYVHCISKGLSQKPIGKCKGDIEKALFHPSKPFLFVLTKRHCYVYNL